MIVSRIPRYLDRLGEHLKVLISWQQWMSDYDERRLLSELSEQQAALVDSNYRVPDIH